MTESLSAGLDTAKEMVTAVLETRRRLMVGREVVSSGSAELKFQSSSVEVPLACWGGGCGADGEKLNSEVAGGVSGCWGFCWVGKGEAVREVGLEREAKGSDGVCGGRIVVCC